MFALVINEQGYKVEFVALNEDGTIQFYELKDGEQVIEKDWAIANGMNKPQWQFDTEIWIETEPLPPVELVPPPVDKISIRLDQQEAAIGLLATQVAKNTLLQNGGIR